MKNLKNLGKVLGKKEQKTVNGGFGSPIIYICPNGKRGLVDQFLCVAHCVSGTYSLGSFCER